MTNKIQLLQADVIWDLGKLILSINKHVSAPRFDRFCGGIMLIFHCRIKENMLQ